MLAIIDSERFGPLEHYLLEPYPGTPERALERFVEALGVRPLEVVAVYSNDLRECEGESLEGQDLDNDSPT